MLVQVVKSVFCSDVSLLLSSDDISELFTIEACPCCGGEQVIWSHGVTRCPECGAALAPCSVCMDERGSCDYSTCPYGCNGTDDDSKKEVTMPDISEDEAKMLYAFL